MAEDSRENYCGRIAPSPTGYLHLGHARTFWTAQIRAEAEVELQRQYNIGNYLLSLENAGRVASRVQEIELYSLAPDFYKTYAKRMAAVTPAKERELAEKYLSTKDTAIVVVGDAKQVRASLEKIGKVVMYDTDLKAAK